MEQKSYPIYINGLASEGTRNMVEAAVGMQRLLWLEDHYFSLKFSNKTKGGTFTSSYKEEMDAMEPTLS